jgi:hypothetical protein
MNGWKSSPAFSSLGCLLLLLVLVAGCDNGPKRYHVSGQVLYDGKPVPSGEILFDPDARKGNDGPQGFARIQDGRYDTRNGGIAAGPGPQIVRIFGFDGKSRPELELPHGRPLFLPEHKTTADIPNGDATIDFPIPALKGSRAAR